MPRYARKKSKTGIYHVILRGVNKQLIFQDNEDRQIFTEKLKKYKFKIYAYCLMDNHVHIMLEEKNEEIGTMIKKVSSSYVYYYNKKYERCGHLFQERYRSEVVEDDTYFCLLIKYIHQNPVKAKIVVNLGDYKWSSHEEYIKNSKIVDTKFYLEMLNKDIIKAREKYKEQMEEIEEIECLDYEVKNNRITDKEAIEKIKIAIGKNILKDIKCMNIKEQKEVLVRIKKIGGIGKRQTSRITGISYGIVRTQ